MAGKFMFLLVCLPVLVQAQVCQSGDNSTVKDCYQCGTTGTSNDENACWQKSLNFVERDLIGQLRNYISSQIELDQWHRNHDEKKGQDYEKLSIQIKQQFIDQLHNDGSEVLLPDYVNRVADLVSEKVKEIATGKMEKVPLFQCPMNCGEKKQTLELTFILSAVLNIVLAIAVLPTLYRSIRPDSDDRVQSEGLVNRAYE